VPDLQTLPWHGRHESLNRSLKYAIVAQPRFELGAGQPVAESSLDRSGAGYVTRFGHKGAENPANAMTPTLSESDSVWNIHIENSPRNGLWCLFCNSIGAPNFGRASSGSDRLINESGTSAVQQSSLEAEL
jgi:hypothetical protein